MRKVKMMVIGILVAGLVISASGVAWAVPSMINVQGRLLDAADNPITKRVSVDFYIFDVPTGGTPVWQGIAEKIDPDDNGIFNHILGTKINPIPDIVGDEYYLAIDVEGKGELNPRQRLVSVPFAITAKNLKGGKVNADGGSGIAVFAQSSGGYAVHGQSDTTDGIHGVGARGGVLGYSSTGYGVYGEGATEGGSFVSTTGNGVSGKGKIGVIGFDKNYPADFTGSYGLLGGSRLTDPSVMIVGTSRCGAFGQTDSGNYGYLGYHAVDFSGTTSKIGVLARSDDGYGVMSVGSSSKGGIVGRTQDAPSFTNTNFGVLGSSNTGSGVIALSNDGYAVFANSANGMGVFGQGNSFGVRGNATGSSGVGILGSASSGIGVQAQTSSSGNPALYAVNTASGPAVKAESSGTALEIAKGGLRVSGNAYSAVDLGTISGYTSTTMNCVFGRIKVAISSPTASISVRNSYVTRTSMILMQTLHYDSLGNGVRTKLDCWVYDVRDGSFRIDIPEYKGSPLMPREISFIVIN